MVERSISQVSFCFNIAYVEQIFMPKDTQPLVGIPLALVHGDLWTNNMLFK